MQPPADSFAPDSPLVDRIAPSPNHDSRKGQPVAVLLLHYTGMLTAEAAIERLADPDAKVSCHYVALEDGGIVQMVPEAQRAWHAGVGIWAGLSDINASSIGIEIVNRGHDFDYPVFPEAQIARVIALCQDILRRHAIAPDHVIGHSDMAPARKRDPGEKFPWEGLHRAGVGHWVQPATITGGRFLACGDQGEPVRALQEMLRLYGYHTEVTSEFDSGLETVLRAFQRHFRPARVDGIADVSTITTLRNLIAARGRVEV